jgi:hypothetical protein
MHGSVDSSIASIGMKPFGDWQRLAQKQVGSTTAVCGRRRRRPGWGRAKRGTKDGPDSEGHRVASLGGLPYAIGDLGRRVVQRPTTASRFTTGCWLCTPTGSTRVAVVRNAGTSVVRQGKAMSERAIARPIPCTAVQHPGMSRKRRSHSGLNQGVKASGAHAISAYRAYPAPSIGAAPMTNHRGLSSGLALPP